MYLLNCARVKDRLHNSENWPRSPFDRPNFVRLSSMLGILGFRNNWMENRCRVVLKRCVNMIGRNVCALAWLKKKRWSEGALSIIYVKISAYEPRTMCRISKLKNKIWYSGHYRHIALLRRTHKHRNTWEDTGSGVKVCFSIQNKKENVRRW